MLTILLAWNSTFDASVVVTCGSESPLVVMLHQTS
jgi:hypothetical protein